MTGAPYPWLADIWRILARDLSRLPHALLVKGIEGIGKRAFGHRLAGLLVCEQPVAEMPCGACKSCHLVAGGTHPDVRLVEPEEAGKSIGIDEVRALREFLALRPHSAMRKVVVLYPAEAMTLQAANALLKQLEEPPLGNVLILISHNPARLPATIRSRCAQIAIHPPAAAEARKWLDTQEQKASQLLGAAGGAPLKALDLSRIDYLALRKTWLEDLVSLRRAGADPADIAARWVKNGLGVGLDWFYGLLLDLVKSSLGADDQVDRLINPDFMHAMGALSPLPGAAACAELAEKLIEARRLLGSGIDEHLLIENILIGWMHSGTS